MRRYLTAVSLVIIFPPVYATDIQRPDLTAGRYEVTIGSQGEMGKYRVCHPEEDLYLALSDVILDRGKDQMRKECSIRTTEQTDSGTAWETLCKNGLGTRTTSGTMEWEPNHSKARQDSPCRESRWIILLRESGWADVIEILRQYQLGLRSRRSLLSYKFHDNKIDHMVYPSER